jgi:DNA-binding transcriptional MerR regulator
MRRVLLSALVNKRQMTQVALKISELSRRARLPIATVKYYLREGLLPAGALTSPNQADYSETHVRRLHLIRTLREVGGLEIEHIRRVIAAIEDEQLSRHALFGVAERAREVAAGHQADGTRQARGEVDRFMDELGWRVRPDASARQELAEALVGLRRLGRDYGTEIFRPYAEVADRMAAWEVSAIPASEPPSVAVERMIVGTVVFGKVFDALRRLAHEHHSATRRAGEHRAGARRQKR